MRFKKKLSQRFAKPRPAPSRPEHVVGHPENWKHFAEKRLVFLERLPRLVKLSDDIYNRTITADNPNDRLIFSFGVLIWEDFEEILVLGMNGYGFGCQKILRGMFERIVTASYLHRHPDETDRFVDFHYISDYKLVREIFDNFGEYGGITKEVVDQRRKARDAVKDKFVRKCGIKDCDKEIPVFSWTNLDFVSMAKTDPNLKDLVGIAYYLPMGHTHATVQSVLSRMSDDGSGLERSRTKALGWADKVVCAAHNLVLQSMGVQLDHFPELKQKLSPVLAECMNDFVAAWGKDAQQVETVT